jgi:prepilin-type N-terminal cleavage/methylation domain-containing protein
VKRLASGFSLVEIMLTVFVLGIVLTLGLRRGFYNKPLEHFPNLLTELNSLAFFSQTQAVASGVDVSMVFLTLPAGGFEVRVEKGVDEKSPDISDVANDYLIKTNFVTSSVFALEKIVVEGGGDGETKVCVFSPNGMCQSCTLHIARDDLDRRVEVSFVLSPFFCKFTHESGFVDVAETG